MARGRPRDRATLRLKENMQQWMIWCFWISCGFAVAQDITAIENMELSPIQQRVMMQQGWDQAKAEAVVREYRRFWIMRFRHPGVLLVPPPDVDEIWHAHILHTDQYRRDCEHVFGQGSFMHHSPSYDEHQTKLDEMAYRTLLRTYENDFGEKPVVEIWGTAEGLSCDGSCGSSCSSKNDSKPVMCPMAMYFGVGQNVCVWLEGWHVTNGAQYAGTVIAILLVCGFREWMTAFRQKRHRDKYGFHSCAFCITRASQRSTDDKQRPLVADLQVNTTTTNRPSSARDVFVESSFYALNVTLAYLIMLLIMTYNVGICVAVIIGLWLGNFVFTYIYTRQAAHLQPAEADHCCEGAEAQ